MAMARDLVCDLLCVYHSSRKLAKAINVSHTFVIKMKNGDITDTRHSTHMAIEKLWTKHFKRVV